MSLFNSIPNPTAQAQRPLAERMRPRTLDEFIGQEQILGPGKPLRTQIERDDPGSMIFWGPPGVGKTTLAKIIANITKAEFIEFSAVLAGIKEIKAVMADAEKAQQFGTAPSCSSTRSIVSTRHNRMPSFHTWRREASALSARPRRILRSRSSPHCSHVRGFTSLKN